MSEKIRLTALEKSRLPDEDVRNSVRFCPRCGREIPADRQLCVFCANTGAIPYPVRSGKKKFLLILSIVAVFFILLVLALFLTRNSGLK